MHISNVTHYKLQYFTLNVNAMTHMLGHFIVMKSSFQKGLYKNTDVQEKLPQKTKINIKGYNESVSYGR